MQTVTYKYRVKDRSARKTLARHAMACNQVWNYCNAFQQDIERRYRAGAPKRRWPSAFDLAKFCKGAGKELGIHQQTVGTVCDQFAKSRDKTERNHRFLEESLELVQSLGCTREEAHQLVDYVFDRPAGDPVHHFTDKFSFAPELRRNKASALTVHVMNVISKYLCDHGDAHGHRDASRALMQMFYESGADIITDADRATAGLPDRGPSGMTREELQILEARRMEAMQGK